MTEPARTPCCIVGCRRTFKATEPPSEYMCGKHYRCDRALLEAFKLAKRRLFRLTRLLNRRFGAGTISASYAEHLWGRCATRHAAAWKALKTKAQEMQDQGFWAPRPRGRKLAPKRNPQVVSPFASAFEAEFQRKKRAMQMERS